jgi:uncharacterized cupredoxin-like copper-binding protein
MKNKALIVLVLFATVGLAQAAEPSYIKDAAKRVKEADWSKMKTVEVVMKEFSFSPSELTFKAGVPYKLKIVNKGKLKHYFVSEGFFRAIATRKVQSKDGEVKAPYFLALEVYPGRSLELFFIPVREGSYKLLCTVPGHKALGMKGKIRIETGS